MPPGRLARRGSAAMSGGLLLAGALAGTSSAQTPSEGIQISEVRADAGRGAQDAAFEWIELHNTSNAPVNLSGWSVSDNRGEDVLPSLTIELGARTVIGRSEELAAELPRDTVFAATTDGRIGNGLANSRERVLLIDPDGRVVDGVSWGSDRSVTELPAPPRGQTLTRGQNDKWSATAPSPGETDVAPASVPAGPPPALRITEVFANAGEGSRDAAFEWIDIHNPTQDAVGLGGWQISDNSATDLLPAARLDPGGYIVIAATANGVDSAIPSVLVEDGRLGNGLANGGDVVTLRDPAGRTLDEVDYRNPAVPLPEAGRSIARTDNGWVLNVDPSPGSSSATPLLADLATVSPAQDNGPAAVDPEGDDGIPAWGLVGIALGVPSAGVGGLALSRRREALARPFSRGTGE